MSKNVMTICLKKEKIIASEIERVEHTHVGTNKKVQNLLAEYGSTPLNSGATIADLIRRPELHYNFLAPIDERRPKCLGRSGRTSGY
mgnify:CR=1 FL=1